MPGAVEALAVVLDGQLPVTVLEYVDLLRDLRKEDAEIEELTRNVLDAAEHGADLTRRLLAFARQQPLRPQRVDINKLISDITRLLSRTLGEDIY